MRARENRKRTRGTTADLKDDERVAVGAVLGGVHSSKKRHSRRHKLRKWERHELSDLSLLLLCLSVGIVVFTVRYRSREAVNYPSLSGVSKEFRQAYQESRIRVSRNQNLYTEVYKLATERLKPPDETAWPEYERRPFELKSIYGPSVGKCTLTIAVLEPKLGKPVYDFGPGQPLWFELESIGAFASDACVVLQTTTCAMKEYLGNDASEEKLQKEIIKIIYDSSLPLFRGLIESGRVRITFMDHHEYNLRTCHDFDSPSGVFMNANFWDRAFLEKDSDTVLIFQEGASLCYKLEDLEMLRSKALVGALWPRETTPLIAEPIEGACRAMPTRWKSWLRPQRRWKMQQEKPELAAKQHPAPKPRELLSEDYPEVCENGRGPVGHGDFSLRSRQWMLQAIATCPHVTFSGLKVEDEPFACKVFETISDDFYFSTVLAGIGAPLPIGFEASLFASQILLPEQALDIYGLPTSGSDLRSSWESRRPTIQLDEGEMTVPNAFIKPWLYHSKDFLMSEVMTNACPFVQYTFTPDISRLEEATISKTESDHWVGIGH